MDDLGNIIDFAVPSLLLLTGLGCLFDAFKNHRRKPKPQCFKCAYDLRASDSLTCPECGFTHKTPHHRLHGRISKPYLSSALLLLALGIIPPIALATQWARNNAAQHLAKTIEPQVSPTLIADRYTIMELSPFSHMTLWVARQAEWGDEPDLINMYLYVPRFQNWSDPRFLCIYTSSLLMSPQHHYGRYVTTQVPWRYASQPTQPNLTTTQTAQLISLAARSPGLKYLLLQKDFPVDDQAIPGLQHAINLYGMDIMRCDLSPKGIAGLASLPKLSALALTYTRQVTDQDIHALLSLPQLSSLKIQSRNKASALTPACLAPGQKAQRFYLDLPIPFHAGSDPAPFKNLPSNWSSLSLILPDITPQQLASMPLGKPYAYLTLDLTGNPHITDADLDWLVKDPDYLRALRLTPGPNITGNLLDRLCAQLSARKPLNIFGTPATLDLDIANLAINQKSLESLAVGHCSDLTLRRCTLGPTSLLGLAKSPTLTGVSLHQTPITPTDFKTLSALPNLKYLTVDRIDDQSLTILAQSPRSLSVYAIQDDTTPTARTAARNITITQITD